jgi:hypothetical protein
LPFLWTADGSFVFNAPELAAQMVATQAFLPVLRPTTMIAAVSRAASVAFSAVLGQQVEIRQIQELAPDWWAIGSWHRRHSWRRACLLKKMRLEPIKKLSSESIGWIVLTRDLWPFCTLRFLGGRPNKLKCEE